MTHLIATPLRRAAWSTAAFISAFVAVLIYTTTLSGSTLDTLHYGELMSRFLLLPSCAFVGALYLLAACAPVEKIAHANMKTSESTQSNVRSHPFKVQVVGLQWMNPLHRRDYPTEWQLLWTLGLAKPNPNDDMVKSYPKDFSTIQPVSPIAVGKNGRTTFKAYHEQYIDRLTTLFHDPYFSNSTYFYNAHSLTDRSTWRELAGIHIEYALPIDKLDSVDAANYTKNRIMNVFAIGNSYFPNAWSRNTPPTINILSGGSNAGFGSLEAAMRHLENNPSETVWAMNWDAPSYPPNDEQMNENMVLLVLAGPDYKTERKPLAWIGYPAAHKVSDFEKKSDQAPRIIQAWKATLDKALRNVGKEAIDIGYLIHDANNNHPDSSERIANLAHITTKEIVEFDFVKQSFNTSALLGEMGAGSALTNVALGIAYANHIGKNVLVAGTEDLATPTAVIITPPEISRPVDNEKPWFRARGGNNAYLMWWGLRHDAEPGMQGYSK